MKFSYIYRSSDGIRHTEMIDASTREEVFSILRERGIKPIKVIAADGSRANGEVRVKVGVPKRVLIITCAVVAVAVGFVSYWAGSKSGNSDITTMATEPGKIKYSVAMPLPRQAIVGNRQRLEKLLPKIFQFPAEVFLAAFAEPGRSVESSGMSADLGGGEDDWKKCLDTPIRIATSDLTEVVDLKRIVAGMKREMSVYLAAGGTIEDFRSELLKRQRLEVSYRERAESRLNEMLAEAVRDKRTKAKKLASAYGYWLKSNASLKSMGIYELPLPEALREYQANMDFAE